MSIEPQAYDLRDFYYHTVTRDTAEKMTEVRARYHQLACYLRQHLHRTRELSLALTHLEDSCMRAIQCLAITEGTPLPIGELHDGNTAAL